MERSDSQTGILNASYSRLLILKEFLLIKLETKTLQLAFIHLLFLLTDINVPSQINCIITHPTLPLTITAHDDRQIRFFDNNTGKQAQNLFTILFLCIHYGCFFYAGLLFLRLLHLQIIYFLSVTHVISFLLGKQINKTEWSSTTQKVQNHGETSIFSLQQKRVVLALKVPVRFTKQFVFFKSVL